jgi:hypothetical protein
MEGRRTGTSQLSVRASGHGEGQIHSAWADLNTYSVSFAAFIHRYQGHRSVIARNREVWQE